LYRQSKPQDFHHINALLWPGHRSVKPEIQRAAPAVIGSVRAFHADCARPPQIGSAASFESFGGAWVSALQLLAAERVPEKISSF